MGRGDVGGLGQAIEKITHVVVFEGNHEMKNGTSRLDIIVQLVVLSAG